MTYKIKSAKILKDKTRLSNGKIIHGYKIIARNGKQEYEWKTTSKRQANKFVKVWEN